MATTATSNIEQALKIISQGGVIEDLVTDSELLDCFSVQNTGIMYDNTTGGRYIEKANQFDLPGSVAASSENDYIPVPQNPKFLNSRIVLKKVVGSLQMTGDVQRKVQGDQGAFINWAEESLPQLVRRLKNSMDRQYIGWGGGILARGSQVMQSIGGGQYTMTVANSFGITGYEQPWTNFLRKDQIVFSSNATGTGLRNPGTTQFALVDNVDPYTDTLTVTADASLAAAVQVGDYIATGDRSMTSFPEGGTVTKEISGLLAAVDNGNIVPTYNNIARSGNLDWQGVMIDGNSGDFSGEFTEDLLMFADDQCRVIGGGQVNLIVTSYSALRAYRNAVKDDQVVLDKRTYVGSKSYAPGKGMPVFLGNRTAEMRGSRKIPPQIAFGIETGSFQRITLNQWEWDSTSGSIWKQVGDSVGYKDAFWSYGHLYEELYCNNPAHNFRVNNLVNVK